MREHQLHALTLPERIRRFGNEPDFNPSDHRGECACGRWISTPQPTMEALFIEWKAHTR